jgi:hypothetical protein
MARKPADLRSMLQTSAKSAPVEAAKTAVISPESTAGEKPYANRHFRPSRANKHNVTGYFDRAVVRQLRMMAAEKDTTIQALLAEALDDLFAKYRLPEIAKAEALQQI